MRVVEDVVSIGGGGGAPDGARRRPHRQTHDGRGQKGLLQTEPDAGAQHTLGYVSQSRVV
jgi:hypothetical protein